MKRSRSIDDIYESSKKTKTVPTTMAFELEKLAPCLIDAYEEQEFTIMAIAESNCGKSDFLSRLINDLWGFGPDHALLLPTNTKNLFVNCTKVPIMIRHSDSWTIKLVSGGGVKQIGVYDGLSAENVFIKIQTELKTLNDQYDASSKSYIVVSGPFGNMPSVLVLIDMPVMVHDLNPIFEQTVGAVVTFARGPLSSGAMCNIFNRLKMKKGVKNGPPMTIFVHDLSPTVDIPSSIKALTALLPDRFNAVDLMVKTRADILTRTKFFTRMFQTFTLVHRDRPWNAHPMGVEGWITDLRFKSMINEIEYEFHEDLLHTNKEFTSAALCDTKMTSVEFMKKDFLEAVSVLCGSKIEGKYAFLSTIRTLLRSFGRTCVYDAVLSWVNDNMGRNPLSDAIIRDTILNEMTYNMEFSEETISLEEVSQIIDAYEVECFDKPWSRIDLFEKMNSHLFIACSRARIEAQTNYVDDIIKELDIVNKKLGEKSTAEIEAAAADKKKFFDKYFNGECKLFEILPKIKSYE